MTASPHPPPGAAAVTTSALQRLLLIGFGLALFALLLAAIEGALALFGLGAPYLYEDPFVGFAENRPLFSPQRRSDGTTVYATNPDKLAFFHRQQFPAEKAPGALRIFALGGSTTAGRPYDDRVSFPRWLERYLRASDPGRHHEVINAGAISYASYRVVVVAKELVDYEPDIFVVYTGHNEFLEERTYSEIIHQSRLLKQLRVWLNGLRSYTLARHAWTREGAAVGASVLAPEVEAKLDVWKGLDRFHKDSELTRSIVEHFEFNLEQLAALAADHGVEVVLIRPASNVKDFSPFKSEHPPSLSAPRTGRFATLLSAGRELLAAGDRQGALGAFSDAATIDPEHAELRYLTGRAHLEEGDFEAARAELLAAKDLDVAPLRALERIGEIVAEVAGRRDLPLVDFPALLEADSRRRFGHTILGDGHFLDHVHPDIPYYSLLAEAVIEALVARRLMPAPEPRTQIAERRRIYEEVLAGIDRRYYAERDHNLGKVLAWAGKAAEARSALERAAEVLVDDPDVHVNLGIAYQQTGGWHRAVEVLERAVALAPSNPEAHFNLGAVYGHLGRLEEATDALDRAVSLKPDDALALFNLGLIHRQLGDLEAALAAFERSLELEPQEAAVHRHLGELHRRLGRGERSLELLDRALQLAPDDPETRVSRGITLGRLGRHTEAMAELRRAVELAPQDAEAHYNLGVVHAATGRREEAAAAYETALGFDPTHVDALNNLGIFHAGAGRWEEAAALFGRAVDADPAHAEALFNLGIVYDNTGRRRQAVDAVRRAIALEPENGRFHFALASLYRELGQEEGARRHFAEAERLGFVPRPTALSEEATAASP